MSDDLRNLAGFLSPGTLDAEARVRAIQALAACWADIPGSGEEGTTSAKLLRAEDVSWNPPMLTFVLERHGGTVNGSSRAELHYWEVNTEKPEAWITKTGLRQLHPVGSRFDAGAVANELSDHIRNGRDDHRLAWSADRSYVRVLIAEAVPATNAQTTPRRRQRFRAELEDAMRSAEWLRSDTGNKMGFRRQS